MTGMTPYDELCCYTLERGDASFIHQHVVDAQIAQQASDATKPIALAFALAGLYLTSSADSPEGTSSSLI
jgi:hypothetical protein